MRQQIVKARTFSDGSDVVIGACIEVHRELGPGLLESAYEEALCHELRHAGLQFERQKPVPLIYKGDVLDCHLVLDLLIERRILLEIKSVERLHSLHRAQVITYLKLAHLETGLLVNFNVPILAQGVRRVERDSDLDSTP